MTKEQREEAMRQGYEALREQFAAVREAYPGAQLHEELESPVFMRLVMRGVDARSAYELTHLRELRAGAMAYGARRAREELTAACRRVTSARARAAWLLRLAAHLPRVRSTGPDRRERN